MSDAYYTPEEAQAVFSAANDAYYKEDYPAAISGYEKLIEHGATGADVLFNLGTAAMKAGDLGRAVLYLERARKLSRSDDIEANLSMARAQLTDKVIGEKADPMFVQRLADATPGNSGAWLFLVCWALFFVALIGMRRFVAHRVKLAITAGLLFVAAAAGGSVVAAHAWVEANIVEGVVVQPALPARSFPKDSAKTEFEVHAGLKVRVLESSGKFVRIRLPNGLEGWTEREGVANL